MVARTALEIFVWSRTDGSFTSISGETSLRCMLAWKNGNWGGWGCNVGYKKRLYVSHLLRRPGKWRVRKKAKKRRRNAVWKVRKRRKDDRRHVRLFGQRTTFHPEKSPGHVLANERPREEPSRKRSAAWKVLTELEKLVASHCSHGGDLKFDFNFKL